MPQMTIEVFRSLACKGSQPIPCLSAPNCSDWLNQIAYGLDNSVSSLETTEAGCFSLLRSRAFDLRYCTPIPFALFVFLCSFCGKLRLY